MQVPVGRRSLLSDRAKFVVAVGGVALAIVLMLVVISLYEGVRRETSAFVQSMPGDIWITCPKDDAGTGAHVQQRSFAADRRQLV